MGKIKSLKSMMIIYFTIIITGALLFTGLALYEKINTTTKAYACLTADQLTDQIKYSLDTYVKNMMNISNTLYYKIIKNENISNNNFASQMQVVQMTNSDIASLAIFRSNGELVSNSKYLPAKENLNVYQEEWFKQALDTPENVHFSTPHRQDLFQEYSPWVVSLSRAVSLNQDGRIIQGVLLVDMNLTGIENICKMSARENTGDIYIASPTGELIYGEENSRNGYAIQDVSKLKDGVSILEGEESILTVKTVGYTGWKIIGIWHLDKILFKFNDLSNFLIGIVAIGIGMCVLGTLYISSKLSSPLYKLQKSMKMVEEGIFDIQIDENGEYIVSELSKTFNKMVNRIQGLMGEILKEQEGKRKKELEALQAQINPHFLYNTLDAIIWLAEDERTEEAVQMITALSRFFRIGISSGRNIITVREEVEHAKNYLDIQKIRYKNRFTYEIEVDEDLLNVQTIKIILQPIIENALYHGIEYIYHEGKIMIEVYKKEDRLIYEVKDNGVGMTEETRQKLLLGSDDIQTKGSGVGVKNVNERIKLYYGEAYGMRVESELDEGTIIYLELPLRD